MQTPPVFRPTRSKYLVFTSDYLIPTGISLTIICLAYFVLYSSFFQIKTITCVLDYAECADLSLLAELDKFKGQNIFMFAPGALSTRLTSGDFTIRQAKFRRELPDKLAVDLQSVYPVVALQIVGDPTWVVMDQDFRMIATRSADPNVPTVVVPGPLTLAVGKPPSDQLIIQSLGLARRLADELFLVKSITLLDADTIQLTLSNGKIALLTPKKDELAQLRTLQTILADATITEGVHTIDVRFASPVLR